MSEQPPISTPPHPYPGKLIIVEGIDGSGKSTQLLLLHKWLESKGHKVFFTEWNSSELVKDTTKRGKKNKSLTPTTFSLLHATDFASRLYHEILPPLKAGMLVLADRYMYTAFARDVVRGVSSEWVRKLYSFAIKPDMAFYFKVPIEVAISRLLGGTRGQFKYYEAGHGHEPESGRDRKLPHLPVTHPGAIRQDRGRISAHHAGCHQRHRPTAGRHAASRRRGLERLQTKTGNSWETLTILATV